jgi:hypothetical protein
MLATGRDASPWRPHICCLTTRGFEHGVEKTTLELRLMVGSYQWKCQNGILHHS